MSLDSNINLGIAAYKEGKLEPAEEYLENALKIEPNCAEANFFLGVAILKQGDVARGIELIDKARNLRPDLYGNTIVIEDGKLKYGLSQDEGSRTLQVLWLKADKLYKSGDYEKAGAVLEEMLERRPNDPFVILRKAIILARLQEYALAAEQLERVASISPEHHDPAFFSFYGFVLVQLGDYEAAIEVLRLATSTDEKNHLNWFWLGLAYLGKGDIDSSQDAFQKAFTTRPDSFFSRFHSSLGRERLLALRDYLRPLGEALFFYQERDYEKSLETMNSLLKEESGASYIWYMYKAHMLSFLEDAEPALLYSEGLLKQYPREAELFYIAASLLYKAEEFEKAVEMFKKATELRAKHSEAWFWLGKSYEALDRNEDALQAFRKSYDIYPTNHLYNYELARASLKNGDKLQATFHAARALMLAPEEQSYRLLLQECLELE